MNSIEQEFSEIKQAESQFINLQSQISHQLFQFQSQYSQQWSNFQNSLKKIEFSILERRRELESKQRDLELVQKSIDDREKELNLKEKQLNCGERFVCDRCKTLGYKVSETGNVVVKIEPLSEFEDDCSVNDASIKMFVTMDGKTLQMFLNDRVDEHGVIGEEVRSAIKLSSDAAKLVLDAMGGFFRPHLKKGGVEYDGSVVRSSCVLLLEQLMELNPEIKKAVREEARALVRDWIEKVNVEKGIYLSVLGFLLLVVVYGVWSDFDKDVLLGFCDVVKDHRVASELRSKFGFLRKCGMSNMGSQFPKEPYTKPEKYTATSSSTDMGSQFPKEEPYIEPVKYAATSSSTDPSIDLSNLCEEINANGLKSYLMENVKDLSSVDDKVLDCLRGASDPAKLVFEIVQEFYLEVDEFQGETNISCCNFLLEQMMKLSPHINFSLKEKIVNFSARWKARLATERTKPFFVFGFLKFLAAFKLSSSFQADEILSLFTVFYDRHDIYEPEQNPKLCRALGLDSKIPDLVQSLIKENKRLTAVHYICAFNLADRFPPSPLLKEYLAYTEAAALSMYRFPNYRAKAQIRALQSVIRCSFKIKLDSELEPITLQQRIRQLEKEMDERKSSKLEKEQTGTKKRPAAGTSPQSDSTGLKKQAVPIRPQQSFAQAYMNKLNQSSPNHPQCGTHKS